MILNKASKALKHASTPFKSQSDVKTPTTKKSFKPSANKLLAKAVISDIIGHSPYELKAMEFLKRDEDKKCKKFLRKRLGKLKTVRRKMDDLYKVIRQK